MKRRDFLAALALSVPARAFGQRRLYRIAWLSAGPNKRLPKSPFFAAFNPEMKRLGLVEQRDYVIDFVGVEGKFERVEAAWRGLEGRKPDIVLAGADRIARRLKPLVKSVPAVFISFDPVREHFVESLARPGGNFTGFSMSSGPELEAKRLQILKEMIPSVRRIAFLGAAFEWDSPFSGAAARAAAQSLGLEMFRIDCGESKEEVSSGLERLARARPDAAFIPSGTTMFTFGREIGEFLRSHRIPGAFGFEHSVEAGGLMSYGADWDEVARKIAGFIARLLKGGDPATMPVEQPSVFRLAINLRTARELGLSIPKSVLLRADRVIE